MFVTIGTNEPAVCIYHEEINFLGHRIKHILFIYFFIKPDIFILIKRQSLPNQYLNLSIFGSINSIKV